jgi:hypothetical protein
MKKPKPATKSAMLQALSSRTELTRKQIATVVDELASHIKQEIGITGAGVIAPSRPAQDQARREAGDRSTPRP